MRYDTALFEPSYHESVRSIEFRRLDSPHEAGFRVEVLKWMGCAQLTSLLSNWLELEGGETVLLTLQNVLTSAPCRVPIIGARAGSVEQMLPPPNTRPDVVFYEVRKAGRPAATNLKSIRIAFHNRNTEIHSEHQIDLPASKTVGDLVSSLQQQLGRGYTVCDIRVMEVVNSKIFKIFDHTTPLVLMNDSCSSGWSYRAEVIPNEEAKLSGNEYLVQCCHCRVEGVAMKMFGDPVWIRMAARDTLTTLRSRLKDKLDVLDSILEAWKFTLRPPLVQPLVSLKEDDDIISILLAHSTHQCNTNRYLGDNGFFIAIEHPSV